MKNPTLANIVQNGGPAQAVLNVVLEAGLVVVDLPGRIHALDLLQFIMTNT